MRKVEDDPLLTKRRPKPSHQYHLDNHISQQDPHIANRSTTINSSTNLVTQLDSSRGDHGGFRSSILHVELMLRRLLNSDPETSTMTSQEKANTCLQLLETMGSSLPANCQALLPTIMQLLRELIFSDDYRGISTNIANSITRPQRPASTEETLKKKLARERRQEHRAMLQFWESLTAAEHHPDVRPVSHAGFLTASMQASLASKTESTFAVESQVKYEPIPYFDLAPTFHVSKLKLERQIAELAENVRAKKLVLDSLGDEQHFLQKWNEKKQLQLDLLKKTEQELDIEVSARKTHLQEDREEIEARMEENFVLEQGQLMEGLTFGGSYALEVAREEHQGKDLTPQIEGAKKQLEEAKAARQKVKDQLKGIYHDRDLLLTRIEVLEQAVRMMHTQVEYLTEWGGEEEETFGDLQLLEGHIGPETEEDRPNWIQCRGTGKHVPIFLRSDGWVRNTNMTKMEAELRIKEIWSLKSLQDQKAHHRGEQGISLSEYFRKYLYRRFQGRQQKMLEFSYNFVACLEKYIIDGDFALFLKVLFEDVHEKHYYDQMMMISNIKRLFSDLDVSEGSNRDGLIPPDIFFPGLRNFFPHKSELFHQELRHVAERDASVNGEISVGMLLEEDDEGYQSNFFECLRDQYLMEIDLFLDAIHAELLKTLEDKQSLSACITERPLASVVKDDTRMSNIQLAAVIESEGADASKKASKNMPPPSVGKNRRPSRLQRDSIMNPRSKPPPIKRMSSGRRSTVTAGLAAARKSLMVPPGSEGKRLAAGLVAPPTQEADMDEYG